MVTELVPIVTIPVMFVSPSMMIASPLEPVRSPVISRLLITASDAERIPTVANPVTLLVAERIPIVAIPITALVAERIPVVVIPLTNRFLLTVRSSVISTSASNVARPWNVDSPVIVNSSVEIESEPIPVPPSKLIFSASIVVAVRIPVTSISPLNDEKPMKAESPVTTKALKVPTPP